MRPRSSTKSPCGLCAGFGTSTRCARSPRRQPLAQRRPVEVGPDVAVQHQERARRRAAAARGRCRRRSRAARDPRRCSGSARRSDAPSPSAGAICSPSHERLTTTSSKPAAAQRAQVMHDQRHAAGLEQRLRPREASAGACARRAPPRGSCLHAPRRPRGSRCIGRAARARATSMPSAAKLRVARAGRRRCSRACAARRPGSPACRRGARGARRCRSP